MRTVTGRTGDGVYELVQNGRVLMTIPLDRMNTEKARKAMQRNRWERP